MRIWIRRDDRDGSFLVETDRKHEGGVAINQSLALLLANYDFRKNLLGGHNNLTCRTVQCNESCSQKISECAVCLTLKRRQ